MCTKVQRVIEEATGKVNLPRGAGGRFMEPETEIPTVTNGALRRMIPVGSAVKERMTSILRRRLIEQVPEANAEYVERLRFAKLARTKGSRFVDKDLRERCLLLS